MKYRHLFFDLDHTLWDFESNSRVVLEVLYRDFDLFNRGIPSVPDFQSHFEQHNEKFWERFRKGQINREELRWKRLWHSLLDFKIRDRQLALEMSAVYLELLPQQKQLVPYALEILDYCQSKGYQMHLITNGFEAAQRLKIDNAGIGHYFEQIVTAQKCGFLKPKPEIFSFALNAASALPSESLMIGDALEADVLGAQNIGMDQAFFNCRNIDHAEKPTYEFTSLQALKDIL